MKKSWMEGIIWHKFKKKTVIHQGGNGLKDASVIILAILNATLKDIALESFSDFWIF